MLQTVPAVVQHIGDQSIFDKKNSIRRSKYFYQDNNIDWLSKKINHLKYHSALERMISEKDKEFTDVFSRFVNGKMGSAQLTGEEWANDHRYLVNEKFKVVMAFIDKLAYCYEQGWYDPRDEWACTLSASIMEHLKEKQLYYSQIKDR